MKYLNILIVAFALISCGGEDGQKEKIKDEFNKAMNELEDGLEELVEEMDSSMEAMKVAFTPYADVERYANGPGVFETYDYNGVFEYIFPEPAEFEENPKSDHISYDCSVIYEGSIYAVTVDDYTESEEDIEIDAGFTKYIHSAFIDYLDGEVLSSSDLDMGDNISAYYSCYTYSLENTYMVDYVAFGFEDYIVHLDVTSRPKCESVDRVNQFIKAFKLL